MLLSATSVFLHAGCVFSCLFPITAGRQEIGEPFDFGQGIEYFRKTSDKGIRSGYYITDLNKIVEHCGSVDPELMRMFVGAAVQRVQPEGSYALILKYEKGLPHKAEVIDVDSIDHALSYLTGLPEKTESHKVIEAFLEDQKKIITDC